MRFGRVRGAVGLAALVVGLLLIFPLGSACGETCPTPEQRAYFGEQEDPTARFYAANHEMTAVLNGLGTSPESFYDEAWRQRLWRILDEMNFALEERVSIETPAGTEELHDLLVQASEAYIEANEMLWEGVLADSAEIINRSSARRIEANRLTDEWLATADSFCE